MIRNLAITSALLVAGLGASAAEVGIRHSSGGGHTTTTHGRAWHNYEGSSQSSRTESGSSLSVRTSEAEVNIGGDSNFGGGYGTPDTGDGRGASCERGNASFCNASIDVGSKDVTRSEYSGTASSEETYRGGSSNRFNGATWNSFSETSTFVR